MGKAFNLLPIITLIVFISCQSQTNHTGRDVNIINDTYLKTPMFNHLQQRIHREREKSVKQVNAFKPFVKNALANTNEADVQLPFTVDEPFLKNAMQIKEDKRPVMTTAFGFKQLFYSIVTAKTATFQYHLFATYKISSYDDCMVWMAIMKQGKFIGLKKIAPYKRSLSYQETPVIQINKRVINVKLTRQANYKLQTKSHYSLKYHISQRGNIKQIKF